MGRNVHRFSNCPPNRAWLEMLNGVEAVSKSLIDFKNKVGILLPQFRLFLEFSPLFGRQFFFSFLLYPRYNRWDDENKI
jgi:hypothetical protein